jgi:hypothetical protein
LRKEGRSRGIKRTNVSRDIAVQTGEDEVAVCELFGRALLDYEVADALREGDGLLPPHGIFVLLPCRALRGADRVQDEVRVESEEENEALADGPCGTEDSWC